ncbi:MAG: two-component sensor histidine kinase [Chromatiales bacterium]|nr:two-component sensor histidine kinase [Chromatiales bacterium]
MAAASEYWNRPSRLSAATERPTARPLVVFLLYRAFLATLFVASAVIRSEQMPFGQVHPELFLIVSIIYLGAVLASAIVYRYSHIAAPNLVAAIVATDVAALTALMYASGGVSSGIGILCVASVAAGGLLLDGRLAMAFAALASIGVLGEQGLRVLTGGQANDFLQAGLLGATFLITTAVVSLMARRVRVSERLAARREVDLENLAQLNAYVIARMDNGMLVIDALGHVRQSNAAAWYLLGMPALDGTAPLESASPELAQRLAIWSAHPRHRSVEFNANGTDLQARFTRLGQGRTAGTLIFLEDSSALKQRAQQLKLASLGRLAASIAHEIRNPLGALSHAAQLLGEDDALDAGSRRMVEIIRTQCARMNNIVENVLEVSREQRSQPEEFALGPWVAEFVRDFQETRSLAPETMRVRIEPANCRVYFDPGHLRQVMTNLFTNALKYGGPGADGTHIDVRGGMEGEAGSPHLDVIDYGPGIAPDALAKIFEPFFTTTTSGTGLGLYLSRELTESNRGRLEYVPLPTAGSCFRIVFPPNIPGRGTP